MRKISSWALAFMLVWVMMPSFAQTITPETSLLKVLDRFNFSSEANDQSEQVKKWVESQYNQQENVLTLLVNGKENLVNKTKGYHLLSQRQVTLTWEKSGVIDAQLGQCYRSKTRLSVIASKGFYQEVTTCVWVKKKGKNDEVSRVSYVVKDREPTDLEVKFESENFQTMYDNLYVYFEAIYASLFKLQTPMTAFTTEQGLEVSALKEASVASHGRIYMVFHSKVAGEEEDICLAQIKVSQTMRYMPSLNTFGLDNYKQDEAAYDLVNAFSNQSVLDQSGAYVLRPGATYKLIYKAKQKEKTKLITVWTTYDDTFITD